MLEVNPREFLTNACAGFYEDATVARLLAANILYPNQDKVSFFQQIDLGNYINGSEHKLDDFVIQYVYDFDNGGEENSLTLEFKHLATETTCKFFLVADDDDGLKADLRAKLRMLSFIYSEHLLRDVGSKELKLRIREPRYRSIANNDGVELVVDIGGGLSQHLISMKWKDNHGHTMPNTNPALDIVSIHNDIESVVNVIDADRLETVWDNRDKPGLIEYANTLISYAYNQGFRFFHVKQPDAANGLCVMYLTGYRQTAKEDVEVVSINITLPYEDVYKKLAWLGTLRQGHKPLI